VRVACALLLFALVPTTIQSIDAIPAHIAGRFRDATGFQQAASGQYFVFDRRSHVVFGVDAEKSSVWEIVHIGAEPGRILDPTAFAVAPDGTFAVADAPDNRQRIQIFTPAGFRTAGFTLPVRHTSRIVFENYVMNGIGSLQFTGHTVLLSQPENGSLVTEYALDGSIVRSVGALRRTGHEADRQLHLAFNSGVPVPDADGSLWSVFQTGEPLLRKYDRGGALLFERHVEGREVDQALATLPTTWPVRRDADGEYPVVTPTIRSAAVDRRGRIWISFLVPYTYVFDRDGDKIRVVQFRAAGLVAPNSLFFSASGHLLTTPGLFEFPADSPGPLPQSLGATGLR
jgi:hypothetical protein